MAFEDRTKWLLEDIRAIWEGVEGEEGLPDTHAILYEAKRLVLDMKAQLSANHTDYRILQNNLNTAQAEVGKLKQEKEALAEQLEAERRSRVWAEEHVSAQVDLVKALRMLAQESLDDSFLPEDFERTLKAIVETATIPNIVEQYKASTRLRLFKDDFVKWYRDDMWDELPAAIDEEVWTGGRKVIGRDNLFSAVQIAIADLRKKKEVREKKKVVK